MNLGDIKSKGEQLKTAILNGVKILQRNIEWSSKLQKEEYAAGGTLDKAMTEVNHFFDSNKSVFDEMKLYRHFA